MSLITMTGKPQGFRLSPQEMTATLVCGPNKVPVKFRESDTYKILSFHNKGDTIQVAGSLKYEEHKNGRFRYIFHAQSFAWVN